jgi:hypothetical protein
VLVQDTEKLEKSLLCFAGLLGMAFMDGTEYGLPQWQAENNKAI